jgi:hypothetical protein
MNEIMSFPTLRGKDWTDHYGTDKDLQEGDLVAMNCAGPSKWYLAWLREVQNENGIDKYLLESIEDGALCWWSNIGLTTYSRERVKLHPHWQWDDKQFKFNDRWHKVANRNDAYIVLPLYPTFGGNDSVTLNVRIRYGFSDFNNPRTFPNWKKLTMKEMESYYKECCELYEQSKQTP